MPRRRGPNQNSSAWIGWALVLLIIVGVVAYAGYRQWLASHQSSLAKQPTTPPSQLPTPAPQPDAQPDVHPAPQAPARPLPGPIRPAPPPEPGVVPPPQPASFVAAPNLFLGNPSGASATDTNNLLLVHTGYTLSYNASRGEPNWVSWRLRKENLGSAPRARVFSPDDFLRSHNLIPVEHKDYTSSGFDRGHLCPHSDRDATTESSYETFLLTNIIPQSPVLNEKTWAALESYLRREVADGAKTAFIVAGGSGLGGDGSKGPATTIAKGKIAVPANCWKVVIMVSGLPATPADIGPNAQPLAVLMPNSQHVGLDWTKYRVSIHEVETETGYSFLSALRPEVAAKLRDQRP